MFNAIRSSTIVAALVFCWFSVSAHADPENCDRVDAIAFPLVEPDTTGRGELCVSARGLEGTVRVANLQPGNAYTVWWIYIDDPAQCTGDTPLPVSLTGGVSACELADFGGEKPLGMFGRMASGIAPRNGILTLYGELGGMQPSSGSEVWFWVFTHGPAAYADGAALGRQLLTPEDPAAGAPHLGNWVDGQRGFPAATIVFTVE